jgi:hypothetical protein
MNVLSIIFEIKSGLLQLIISKAITTIMPTIAKTDI